MPFELSRLILIVLQHVFTPRVSLLYIGKGEMVDVTCGETECETSGPENRACFPIEVNQRTDPDFYNKTCLMFVRTQEVPREDCQLGR